jgi:hypothetical protein
LILLSSISNLDRHMDKGVHPDRLPKMITMLERLDPVL